MKKNLSFIFISLFFVLSCKEQRLNETGGLNTESELIKTIKSDIETDHINWVVTDGVIINLRTGIMLSWVNDSTLQINNKDGSVSYFIQNTRAMYEIILSLSNKKSKEKITILNNLLKN